MTYVASTALLMYIAAYFVNMFRMFLSRLSLLVCCLYFRLCLISVIYTVLCELRLTGLYKVRHIAAKLSHETNLAITKLSLSLIHNTIGLGLPMFINATTRQQISIYSTGPYRYLLACTYPHIWKSGGYIFFARSACESCFVPPP